MKLQLKTAFLYAVEWNILIYFDICYPLKSHISKGWIKGYLEAVERDDDDDDLIRVCSLCSSQVLELNQTHAKALFRRAQAWQGLKEFNKAMVRKIIAHTVSAFYLSCSNEHTPKPVLLIKLFGTLHSECDVDTSPLTPPSTHTKGTVWDSF